MEGAGLMPPFGSDSGLLNNQSHTEGILGLAGASSGFGAFEYLGSIGVSACVSSGCSSGIFDCSMSEIHDCMLSSLSVVILGNVTRPRFGIVGCCRMASSISVEG